jgi:hypothetical protein
MFFAFLNVAFFAWQTDMFNLNTPKATSKAMKVDPNIPKLVLITELSKQDKKKAAEAKKPRPTPKAKPEPEKVAKVNPQLAAKLKEGKAICYALGPFDGLPQAQNISEKLKDLGAYTTERAVTTESPIGYWVYLPSFDSWKTAKDEVVKLEGKGFKDMFIVGRGQMKNAVSLGLFKNEDGAKERVSQLKNIGEKPKIQTQYKQQDLYWIDIDVEPGKDQVVSTIEKIAQSLTVLELNSRKCK